MKRAAVHVIGAGLSGLSTAICLVGAPVDVIMHEALAYAGGRRRSFLDEALGLTVDSGNFPVLACHRATLELIERIGARSAWRPAKERGAAFADMATGERWTMRPGRGRCPGWLLDRRRRAPNTTLADYWALRRLLRASPSATLADVAGSRPQAAERIWRPLALAAANAGADEVSARLVGAAIDDLLRLGGRGARALLPIDGVGRALIEPALKTLRRAGVAVRFERRLVGLDFRGGRVVALEFEHDRVDLGPDDAIVLATPPTAACALAPGLQTPQTFHATITVHFACPPHADAPEILGVANGAFHWLFCYGGHISVTIKNAGERVAAPRETIAAECWRDVAALTGLSDARPAWRVVAQRRASFAATPAEDARRPGCETRWRNLFLAGAYVQNGLPDTIESAVRSGRVAAERVAARLGATLAPPLSPTLGDE